MTYEILINDLANLPHRDGQIVLEVRRPEYGVMIQCAAGHEGGSYWVHGTVYPTDHLPWGNCAAPRRTVKEARDLAARLCKEGENFNVTVG